MASPHTHPATETAPEASGRSGMDVRLSDVMAGLSYALDLTEGQRVGHALRSCLIGMRIGEILGLDAGERSSLFYALLMKDLGCSSNAARFAALFAADDHNLKSAIKTINWTRASESFRFVARNVAPGAFWLKRVWQALGVFKAGPEGAREVVRTRCERGADIARLLRFSPETVQAIRALDEHWNGHGQPYGLKGCQIPILGRILGLSQTVEVFASTYDVPTAFDMAATRRGRWFDPELVDAFFELRGDHAFWRRLRDGDLMKQIAAIEPAERAAIASERQIDEIAEAFSRVIDAKSPWTYRHSLGVADAAVRIGRRMGLGDAALRDLNRAACLHDLGKLGVSNMILDKPGRLTEAEMTAMRTHTGHTLEILRRVGCFRHLAPTAAAHHERLDGRGYHLGLSADAIDLPTRILGVADAYDALRASRPYRAGLPVDRALEILTRDAGDGLDPAVVEMLRNEVSASADADSYAAPAVQLVPALSEDYHQAA